MTSGQWLQWKTFMALHPFHYDQERADIRAALIALAIWNVQIAKSGGQQKPTFRKIEEFLMTWGDAETAQMFATKKTDRDMWDELKLYAESIGKAK